MIYQKEIDGIIYEQVILADADPAVIADLEENGWQVAPEPEPEPGTPPGTEAAPTSPLTVPKAPAR
jgi:hypothetical protein